MSAESYELDRMEPERTSLHLTTQVTKIVSQLASQTYSKQPSEHGSERGSEHSPVLRVKELKKVFRSGKADLVLFENLSFEVKRGEMLAIVGESGAGKSTLLHILSALERASSGDVYCAQLKLNSLSADEAAEFRNREAGFVWQFHYLLSEFTAAENVAMPLLVRGQSWAQAAPEAARWLREVGA